MLKLISFCVLALASFVPAQFNASHRHYGVGCGEFFNGPKPLMFKEAHLGKKAKLKFYSVKLTTADPYLIENIVSEYGIIGTFDPRFPIWNPSVPNNCMYRVWPVAMFHLSSPNYMGIMNCEVVLEADIPHDTNLLGAKVYAQQILERWRGNYLAKEIVTGKR